MRILGDMGLIVRRRGVGTTVVAATPNRPSLNRWARAKSAMLNTLWDDEDLTRFKRDFPALCGKCTKLLNDNLHASPTASIKDHLVRSSKTGIGRVDRLDDRVIGVPAAISPCLS